MGKVGWRRGDDHLSHFPLYLEEARGAPCRHQWSTSILTGKFGGPALLERDEEWSASRPLWELRRGKFAHKEAVPKLAEAVGILPLLLSYVGQKRAPHGF